MTEPEPTLTYPGGDDDPRYITTLHAGAVIFLLTICGGLLNYIGYYVRHIG